MVKELTKDEAFRFLSQIKTIVLDEEQSKDVQTALFRAGFVWPNGKKCFQNTKEPFLFTDKNGIITCSTKDLYEDFWDHNEILISPFEILSIEIKYEMKQWRTGYEND